MNTKNPDGLYEDYLRFRALWRTRKMSNIEHSAEIWDERAQEWIDDLGADGTGKREMTQRVSATAAYLRSRGLLRDTDSVIDVGCGPGLFAAEFAKSCKRSFALDYSRLFLEYASSYASSQGLNNLETMQFDFINLDIEKAGLTGQFDLVFTSITPAATGEGCLEKLIKMSRAYCYNASFVYARDELSETVMRDVFNEKYRHPRGDGTGFYAMLNLLWLMGYYPETSYYDDYREEILPSNERTAQHIADNCSRTTDSDIEQIHKYIKSQGSEITRRSHFKYGGILWDVRECNPRVTS